MMNKIRMMDKMEMVGIQIRQCQKIEKRIKFIVENSEKMIKAMYEKAGRESLEYLKNDDLSVYTLWRGQRIDDYMFSNLFATYSNGEYVSEVRRDMAKGEEE